MGSEWIALFWWRDGMQTPGASQSLISHDAVQSAFWSSQAFRNVLDVMPEE